MAIKLPQHVEERTFEVRITCPIGGPYTVKAWRQLVLVDESGKRTTQILDGEERIIERIVTSDDPEAAGIAAQVSGKIDKWAQEDIG